MVKQAVRYVVLLVCASLPASGQDAGQRSTSGWPCAGTVDPTYVQGAEATGGKVLLFRPTETRGAAADMAASREHDATVFRAAGRLGDAVHEFEIPIDSAIESAYFFMTVQCLQFATVVQPAGDELRADATGVTHHAFDAIRLFTVRAPAPGTWKVSLAGRGFFSLIVSAKTELALGGVSLVRNGAPIKGLAPLGHPVGLEVSMTGEARQVGFYFIALAATPLRRIDLDMQDEADGRRTYAAEVTLPKTAFRVLMNGIDANGYPFQRVTSRLFVGR